MAPARHAAAFLLSCLLMSCAAPQVHVHDRHVLSYPLVRAFAKSHPGTTLVLLDYHHDIAPFHDGVTSFNWVGVLADEALLSRVVWVSGRTLLLPNRSSRTKWLRRSLAGFAPSDAARIEQRVLLADWDDLRSLSIRGPLVVTLDLDILAHDPGDPPERFLDELSDWISRHHPPLLTVALSAAYQRDAASAWSRLERFTREYSGERAQWYLEAGVQAAQPESSEENGSWRLWADRPDEFARYGQGFWPGAGIWVEAPANVRSALLRRSVRAGDPAAADVLSGWEDADRVTLEGEHPEEELERLTVSAAQSLEAGWAGERLPEPPPGKRREGVAVRLLNAGLDRGCLALFTGVTDAEAAARSCAQAAASDPRYPPVLARERPDLQVELSVFGPWHEMKDAMDFRPGLDSLLLEQGGHTTLLQASLAVQRRYDRGAFLAVLSRKAGLGTDGWKRRDVTLSRAATIWYLRTLPSIEADPSFRSGSLFRAPGPRRK